MAELRVFSPSRGFSGVVAGVTFSGGAGVVDEEAQAAALAYFRRKGYKIGTAPKDAPADTEDAPVEQETGGLTDRTPVAEVRAYAEGLGIDTEGKSKKVLLSMIAETESA